MKNIKLSQIINNANLNSLLYSYVINPKTGLVLFGSEYSAITEIRTEGGSDSVSKIYNKKYAFLVFLNLIECRIEYVMTNRQGDHENIFRNPSKGVFEDKSISQNLFSGRLNPDMIATFKNFYNYVTNDSGWGPAGYKHAI